jgi:hypothetical protein
MTSWNYIVVGLCLLLLLWLLVQEFKRDRRSLLASRALAVVLAVGALAGMALPLGHHRERMVGAGVAPSTAAASPAGIVAAGWQRRLGKGERLRVQGDWKGRPVKVLLTGMGAVLDSADVRGEFELTTVPAAVGRMVFGLVVLAGADTLEREEVPVEVSEEKPLKVLVLGSSPDFEHIFLMNFLGREGDAVASRVAVSKGKYALSFVNMDRRPLEPLSPALLGGFDLVIADSSALPVAGSVAAVMLRRQVEEKGLGLLIRVDSSVRIGRPGMRVLERDSAGRVVVGCLLAGAGKVIYSASNTSYTQWLAGRKEAYAAYWTMLLRQAARASEREEEWNWRPWLPKVGEPVDLELASGNAAPQGLVRSGGQVLAVYLQADAAFSWRWRGRYWPVSAGWQTVQAPGGDTLWGYAWGAGSWKGVATDGQASKAAARLGSAGGRGHGSDGSAAADGTGKVVREWVEIPRWILYMVFLLSMFFLWVERKMGGMNG